jgi:hypothetical protein
LKDWWQPSSLLYGMNSWVQRLVLECFSKS